MHDVRRGHTAGEGQQADALRLAAGLEGLCLADEYGVVCADSEEEVQAHDGEDHEAREENDGGVFEGALA
jgi:hypothetical protein